MIFLPRSKALDIDDHKRVSRVGGTFLARYSRWLGVGLGIALSLPFMDFLFVRPLLMTVVVVSALASATVLLVAGRLRGVASLLGGVAVVPFLTLALMYWGPALSQSLSRREFNSPEWKAAAAAHGRHLERRAMVDDLLCRFNLQGMTRDEVLELLGRSDEDARFGRLSSWTLVYWIGRDRGIGMDSEWLGIRLGQDERVVEYRLIED